MNFLKFTFLNLFCLVVGLSLSSSVNAQQYTNLLTNSGTNSDLSGWTVTQDQGTGHAILPTGGFGGTGAVQAGYRTQFEQVIDLVAAGYSEEFLDSAPIVRYADWIKGAGPDVADLYEYEITLLDASDNEIAQYSSYTENGWVTTTAEWSQNTKSFLNYGEGLRKLKILRNGVDAEFNQTAIEGVVMDAAYLSVGNHLTNGSDRTGDLSGWTVDTNGGDGWFTGNNTWPGFQTSFETCTKSQSVDLLSLGYTAEELDAAPIINIWEFFIGIDGPGNGTGLADEHNLIIELRDASGNVIDSYDSGTVIGTDTWQQVGATFQDYGTGLREVYVQHGGIDAEYWTGYYGGIVDATQMTLTLADPDPVSNKDVEALNNNFSIFPNPVNAGEAVTISLENDLAGTYLVEVHNVVGALVNQTEVEKDGDILNTQVNLGNVTSGVYLVTISKDAYRATQRIIVK